MKYLSLCLFACLVGGLSALEPWEADRTFWLNMNWRDVTLVHAKETGAISAGTARGDLAGERLAPGVVAVAESPWWLTFRKWLPTGGTNEAVAWPAADIVDARQGSISLYVQGRDWNVATPARETFVVLDGAAGSLAVGKFSPGRIGVAVNGTPVVEVAYDQPERYRHVVVTWAADALVLYLDRERVGEARLALPVAYERLVVGQLGDGPGSNKVIDDVAVYSRPLLPSEVTKVWYTEGKHELTRIASIPPLATPPVIDGIFAAGEWDAAAGIAGFVDASQGNSYVYWGGSGKPWPVLDTIRLGYDGDWLYFAYHCPPPAEIEGNEPVVAAMLKSTRTGFDTDVDADDSLFIDIHRPYPAGDMYHFIVNGINTHYEFSDGGLVPGSQEKGRDLQFNPAWETASTLTMDGWHLEGKIPFAAMKLDPPRPGGTLHVNFMRIWQRVLSGTASWAHGFRHGPEDTVYYVPAGELRFAGPEDVVCRLTEIGNLAQGKLDFRGTLVNPGAAPATIRLGVTSNSGELDVANEIAVPAHGTAPFAWQGRAVAPDTGDVTLRLTNATTGALVHASTHPIFRPDHPSIYFRKYPSWHLVKFETEFDALAHVPAGDIRAVLEVRPAAGGDPVATQEAAGFARYVHTFELATEDLPRGDYVATVRYLQGATLLDTATYAFSLKPLPEWVGNRIGADDPEKPPYPFTRMELRGNNEVCVWGRIYRWGNGLLPVQIEVNPDHTNPCLKTPRGRPVLRAPMRLAGDVDGTAFDTTDLAATSEWTDVRGVRVAGTRTVTVGNLRLTADVATEYDGFTWVKLTLAPVAGKVELRALMFEELFTPEFTDVVNTGEYSLVGTGAFPDRHFAKSATLPIWVGNGDGGLQTVTEHLHAWHVQDLQTTMQLEPTPAGGVMRYHMVDQPLVLTGPRVIEFGWNATPTRLKTWRTYRDGARGHRSAYFTWYRGPEWLVADPGWANVYFNGPMIGAVDSYGTWERSQPYMNTDMIPVNDPDVQEWGDEWLLNESDRWRDQVGNVGAMIRVTYASPTYVDWVMYRMNGLFEKAPFTGWYYDVVGPRASANPYAHAGIERPDGTRAATSCLRQLRELTKRLYTLCRHTYPDGQAMIHDSGMPNMAYMAFCEVFFDGENLNSSINAKQPTYRGVLTPERFRAEYTAHNFGPQLWWLGQNRITAETAARFGPANLVDHLSGLMLLHDTPVIFAGGFGHGGCNDAQRRNEEAIRRYDLYGCGYRFLPYWRGTCVSGLRDRQFASWYVRAPIKPDPRYWQYWSREETDESLPHRAVGIFCNESDWQGTMDVQVDLAKLGFSPGVSIAATNAVHRTDFRLEDGKPVFFPNPAETATLSGNVLRFPMTPWNYRMIVLEEVPE